VHASQKIGLSKSAGLDVPMEGPIGDLTRSGLRIHPGSLTEKVHRISTSRPASRGKDEPEKP
jgi:hypothetical protein